MDPNVMKLFLVASLFCNIAGIILVGFYYNKYIIERGINAYLTEKYMKGDDS